MRDYLQIVTQILNLFLLGFSYAQYTPVYGLSGIKIYLQVTVLTKCTRDLKFCLEPFFDIKYLKIIFFLVNISALFWHTFLFKSEVEIVIAVLQNIQ